jgi:proline iminopeptidase
VFVIGSSGYSRFFSGNLRDHYEMIFSDSRHFIPEYHPSQKELAALSLDTWADDVEMIRKELDLDKIIVIGHSVHAQVAMRYAARYPENVRSLVLICGVPYASGQFAEETRSYWEREADDKRKSLSKLQLRRLDSLLKITPAEKQFSVSYANKSHLYWADPNYDAGYLADGFVTSPGAFNVLFRSALSRQESLRTIENLRMPVLVICGDLDFSIPHTVWEQLLLSSGIDYRLMKNAGHNPQTESTTVEQFDELLIDWVWEHCQK